MEGFQYVYNIIMTNLLGFRTVQELLDAVPAEHRLQEGTPHQDQVNHAVAIRHGFDDAQEMVDAFNKLKPFLE